RGTPDSGAHSMFRLFGTVIRTQIIFHFLQQSNLLVILFCNIPIFENALYLVKRLMMLEWTGSFTYNRMIGGRLLLDRKWGVAAPFVIVIIMREWTTVEGPKVTVAVPSESSFFNFLDQGSLDTQGKP
ncbi:hypothetical protein ACJX0J_038953, partial [Zea mays]